jgi:predicted nucleotidyltransferase
LRHALQDYAAALKGRFGERLRLVSLFGSWARGEASPDSDVDVAVVIDGLSRAEWADAVGLVCDVEASTDVFLSPFVLSSERFAFLLARERQIAQDIVTQGIPP